MLADLEYLLFKKYDGIFPLAYEAAKAAPTLTFKLPPIPFHHNDLYEGLPLNHWLVERRWETAEIVKVLESFNKLMKMEPENMFEWISKVLRLTQIERRLLILDNRIYLKKMRCKKRLVQVQMCRLLQYIHLMTGCKCKFNHSTLIIDFAGSTYGIHADEWIISNKHFREYQIVEKVKFNILQALGEIQKVEIDGPSTILRIVKSEMLEAPIRDMDFLMLNWAYTAQFSYRIDSSRKLRLL